MAVTPSQMLELGTKLPEFALPDATSGRVVRSSEFASGPLVVAVICNHCPFVKHIRSGLAAFGRDCEAQGVRVVAVSSNDVSTHPDDGPAKMAAEAKAVGYTFPYLYDETQAFAKALRAACTPEFYLFDQAGRLAYRGQFDASRPGGSLPVTGSDLRHAVEAVVAGKKPAADQKPSIGCNIKWKSGNAPDYF